MNQKTKKAIKKSISHWEKMLKWASKQDESEKCNLNLMADSIKEIWTGEDCPLCDLFHDTLPPGKMGPHVFLSSCSGCPLYEKYGHCGGWNKNAWILVHQSVFWGQWCRQAKKMIFQLERLLK